MSTGHCINCQEELGPIDNDPNGDANPTCARCRAEEDHDFDAEPNVTFDRAGNQITVKQIPVALLLTEEEIKQAKKQLRRWKKRCPDVTQGKTVNDYLLLMVRNGLRQIKQAEGG